MATQLSYPKYDNFGSGVAGPANVRAIMEGLRTAMSGTRRVEVLFTKRPPTHYKLLHAWHKAGKVVLDTDQLQYGPVLPRSVHAWSMPRLRTVKLELTASFTKVDVKEFEDKLASSVECVMVELPRKESKTFIVPARALSQA